MQERQSDNGSRSCLNFATWRRCERWLRLVWCVHRAGILRVTYDRRPSSRCDFQTRQSYWDHLSQSVQLSGPVYHDPGWDEIQDVVLPLKRNLHGHPSAGLLWERQFEKVLTENDWRNVPNLESLFMHHEKDLFLSVCVDDTIKGGGERKTIWNPCGTYGWNNLISKSQQFCKSTYTWEVHSENARQIWNPRKKTKDLLGSLITADFVKQFRDREVQDGLIHRKQGVSSSVNVGH